MANTLKFGIVLVVINLHTLSAWSAPLYYAMYVATVGLVVLEFVWRYRNRPAPFASGMFSVWLLIGLAGFAVSLALISPGGAAQGLVRFLFTAPLFLALVLYTSDTSELRTHLLTAVGFFTLASLTVPLQFVTGPISWFPEASKRAGLERYSSLVGNLTSIGVVVGAYIVLTQLAPRRFQWIGIVLLVVTATLSLQKSAVANVVIGLAVLVFMNRHAWKRMAIVGGAAAGLVIIGYFFVPLVRDRIAASLLSFGITPDPTAQVINDDVNIWAGLWGRLVTLPQANFEALSQLHSPLVYLTGGGFGMASTALVPAASSLAPMAHNQFAELLTVFGPFFGLLEIAIIIRIGYLLCRRARRSPIVTAIAFAFAILLLNSFFANGTIYQPASATIFYFAFFAATSSVIATRDQFEPSLPYPALRDHANQLER